MTEHNPAGSPAKKQISLAAWLARFGRIVICILTAGFVYPHAFVENMDLAEIQRKNEGELYNKK